MFRSTQVLFLILFVNYTVTAQITGVITNTKKEKLPYVNVYLENTQTGTSSNDNGYYNLVFNKKGKHTIVFQVLGFKTLKKVIEINKFPYTLNVTLVNQDFVLDEVKVTSKEDIGKKIIRKAIKSKEKNTKHLQKFTADFYSKGIMNIKNAPKKVMGQKLEFPFPLDSTRSGIIYLSETVSKISSQKKPQEFKEHIIASKISGKDNGVSFNQADEVNFNIYKNMVNIDGKDLISPISNYALEYYRFKLEGISYDDNQNMVNKIKVIPKRKNSNVFSGFIYIIEDNWSVYGLELTVTGNQLNHPGIKKLTLKQEYKYLKNKGAWNLILQTIDYKLGFLGINLDGRFSASYSNYNLVPKFDKKTFTNEILSFDENATKKDSVYWQKLRPIPLTIEEKTDYIVKDSIKVIVKSQKYLDSIDRKNNKFSFGDAFFGYSYRNSYKKWNVGYQSPISKIDFNTVQGWNSKLGVYFFKELNEFGKWYRISSDISYGLSDKKLRPTGTFKYKWDNKTKPIFSVSTGVKTTQFDGEKPISRLYNQITTLFFKRNYMKLYDKEYATINFSKDVFNGVRFYSGLEYAKRNPLLNTTDYTFIKYNDREYSQNNPLNPPSEQPCFTSHNIFKASLSAKINFGSKYMTLPNQKFNIGSNKYPELILTYRKMFGAENKELNSDVFIGKLTQKVKLGRIGDFKYHIKGGMFLKKKDIAFMDFLHPKANQLPITNLSLDRFNLLDYYKLSSNDKLSEWNAEHNFKGFILGKIPLINKLNFHLVTSGKALFTANNKPYTEYSIGLGNIGFGKWRFLRVDYVKSNFNGRKNNGFIFGVKF